MSESAFSRHSISSHRSEEDARFLAEVRGWVRVEVALSGVDSRYAERPGAESSRMLRWLYSSVYVWF